MARRLSPYKHEASLVHPTNGFMPLTAGLDVETVVWSYTEAKWREYHVETVRKSDKVVLTHVSFRVRR